MLEQAGVSRMQSDYDLCGPTNMHNLLELVQKEQDIYNVVFHELIRQVHECCVRYIFVVDTLGSIFLYSPKLYSVLQTLCIYHLYAVYMTFRLVCIVWREGSCWLS